jgi:hypothetical protein
MRHLFIELSYFTADFLNIWMHEENDDILEQLYKDWEGTSMHSEDVLDFYKKIKSQCPETVFHGIDVGHQFQSTGQRYLKYLLENGKDETDSKYKAAKESIDQGRKYYGNGNKDYAFRENIMAENFLREYELLNGADIMGIFGIAHTDVKGMGWNASNVPCMANQLKTKYGDALQTIDISKLMNPYSTTVITLNNKEYTASFFGKEDLSQKLKDYEYREIWRVEDAYTDFKDYPTTGNVLPYKEYPMDIENGQVFKINYKLKDGTYRLEYHRSDGRIWQNKLVTSEMKMDL